MDEERIYNIVLLVMMVLCWLFGYQIGKECAIKPVPTQVISRIDTLLIRDTITREKPVYTHIYIRDTMRVQVNDTIYIDVPREVRVYEDSLYYAEVSGYEPSLDLIDIYQTERIITRDVTSTQILKVKTPSRWGIGVQVGYGIGTHNGTFFSSPYCGVGISYNLITF